MEDFKNEVKPVIRENYLENIFKIDPNYLDSLKDHTYLGSIAIKVQKIPSQRIKKRVYELIINLNSKFFDESLFRKQCFEGIPDELPMLRSLVWKIMFELLPTDIKSWDKTLEEKRSKYKITKENIIVKLELDKKKHSEEYQKNKKLKEIEEKEKDNNSKIIPNTVIKKKKQVDHPLSTNSNSVWKSYFDDLEISDIIEKDVRRTRTHMHFFFMPANTDEYTKLTNEDIANVADMKRNDPYGDKDKLKYETNADVMCRILFIFAKLYPEIKYIQGMNEILATIYYCFSLDKNPAFSSHIEADSFLCFDNFMCKIKDIFIRKKDISETGINGRLNIVFDLLKTIDKELYDHFVSEKIEIQYFAFRWYTLFLTQEFELPDVLRLWDTLLSIDELFDFMNFLCLAIIKIKRSDIIIKDFSGMMLSLQNLDKIIVENVIEIAVEIRTDYYSKKNKSNQK